MGERIKEHGRVAKEEKTRKEKETEWHRGRGREILTNWKAVKPKARRRRVVGCKEKRASTFGGRRAL